VLGPGPSEAVSHQLDPDGAAVLALRVLLGPAQEAELVLDGVPVLVCDGALLSQRAAVRAEAAGQLGKEAGVDIDLRVRGAVERADLVGRRSTRGRGGAGMQDGVDGAVGLAETRELVGPEKSCTLLTVPMTRHCTSRLAPKSAAAPDLGRVRARIVVEARGGSARSRSSSSPPRLGLKPARRVRHTGVCPYAVF